MGLVDEARESVDGARRQLAVAAPVLAELARRLRATPPTFVLTCARGSSDHAATYGKYLIETHVGCPVASGAPSVASIYKRSLRLDGSLVIAVSQSGQTPDVLELVTAARAAGALVVGLVNVETSPLARACDLVLPLCAGDERAIAATKSFLLAGLGFLQLTAAWSGAREIAEAAERVPEMFEAACATRVDLAPLAAATSAYVIARGIGFGAALELALKLKETCRLHAEAFSTAEVHHGPIALVTRGFPVVVLRQDDETSTTTRATCERLASHGAALLDVPVPMGPAVVQPLASVLSCYLALPALAAARGLDADAPPHLRKITETW